MKATPVPAVLLSILLLIVVGLIGSGIIADIASSTGATAFKTCLIDGVREANNLYPIIFAFAVLGAVGLLLFGVIKGTGRGAGFAVMALMVLAGATAYAVVPSGHATEASTGDCLLLTGGTMSGDIDMNSHNITRINTLQFGAANDVVISRGAANLAMLAAGDGLAFGTTSTYISSAVPPQRSVTKVICASDSVDTAQCDYRADGTSDNVEINAALTAVAAKCGKVVAREGTYTFAATVTPPACTKLSGYGATFRPDTTSAITIMIVTGGDNITYEGFTLDGLNGALNSGGAAIAGLDVSPLNTGRQHITLRDLLVQNFSGENTFNETYNDANPAHQPRYVTIINTWSNGGEQTTGQAGFAMGVDDLVVIGGGAIGNGNVGHTAAGFAQTGGDRMTMIGTTIKNNNNLGILLGLDGNSLRASTHNFINASVYDDQVVHTQVLGVSATAAGDGYNTYSGYFEAYDGGSHAIAGTATDRVTYATGVGFQYLTTSEALGSHLSGNFILTSGIFDVSAAQTQVKVGTGSTALTFANANGTFYTLNSAVGSGTYVTNLFGARTDSINSGAPPQTSAMGTSSYTITATGNTTIANWKGMGALFNAPAISSASANVTRASTVHITGGPTIAGGATLTLSSALDVIGNTTFQSGDLIVNASGALLAQNATSGFLQIPGVATGKPSGAPGTALTGSIPFAYDSVNNELCVYFSAAWKCSAALTN